MGRTTRAAAGGNAMAASWHFNVDDNGVVHLQRGSKATTAPLATLTTWSSRVEISTTSPMSN